MPLSGDEEPLVVSPQRGLMFALGQVTYAFGQLDAAAIMLVRSMVRDVAAQKVLLAQNETTGRLAGLCKQLAVAGGFDERTASSASRPLTKLLADLAVLAKRRNAVIHSLYQIQDVGPVNVRLRELHDASELNLSPVSVDELNALPAEALALSDEVFEAGKAIAEDKLRLSDALGQAIDALKERADDHREDSSDAQN